MSLRLGVAGPEQRAAAALLGRLAVELEEVAAAVPLVPAGAGPDPVALAAATQDAIVAVLRALAVQAVVEAARRCALLARLLPIGLLEYEGAEQAIAALFAADPAVAARAAGRRAAGGSPIVVVHELFGMAALLLPDRLGPAQGGAKLLADPGSLLLLRAGISSADDYLALFGGAAAGPPPRSQAAVVGDDPYRVAESARIMLALLGGAAVPVALRGSETPVAIQQAHRRPIAAPASIGELLARIPPSAPGAPQLRIERYPEPGGASRWLVYLAGTVEVRTGRSTEPWDMISNLAALAHTDAGSLRAARAAMREAGVRPGDAVGYIGYSQGGLLAMRLAQEGAAGTLPARTAGVITVGAPAGQLALDHGVPVLALEHADDLVPALGGLPGDHGPRRATLSARAIPAGVEAPMLSAHHLDRYQATLAAWSARGSPGAPAGLAEAFGLAPASSGAAEAWRGRGEGVATFWRADRIVRGG